MEDVLYRMPLECEQTFEYMLSNEKYADYHGTILDSVYLLRDPYGEVTPGNCVAWRDAPESARRADATVASGWVAYQKLLAVMEDAANEMREHAASPQVSDLAVSAMHLREAVAGFNELAGDARLADTFAELTCAYYRMDPPDGWIRSPEEAIWEAGFSIDDIAVRGDRDALALSGMLKYVAASYKDPIKDKLAALDNVRACAKELKQGAARIGLPAEQLPLWMSIDLKIADSVLEGAASTRLELAEAYRKSMYDTKASRVPQLAVPFTPQCHTEAGEVLFDSYDYSRLEELPAAVEDMRALLAQRLRGASVAFAVDGGGTAPECYGLVDCAAFREAVAEAAGPVVKYLREAEGGGVQLEVQPTGAKPFTMTAYAVIHSPAPGFEFDQECAKRAFDDAMSGRDMLERKRIAAEAIAAKQRQSSRGGLFGRRRQAER